MPRDTPGEVDVIAHFSRHLGGRIEGAGLRIQFHYNQAPGIHFKAEPSNEYRTAILSGLRDGLAVRFPRFPGTASLWVTEIMEHAVHSSQRAFYLAARMAIDQAFSLSELSSAQPALQADRPEAAGPAA